MGNEAWKQDLAEFKAVTEKFYNKEVSAKDYKARLRLPVEWKH